MTEFLLTRHIFGFSIYQLLFWFLVYGVVGWIFESAVKSFDNRKFTNRGFLFGPFIPIYAFGITGFVLLLNPIVTLPPAEIVLPFLPAGKQVIKIEYNYYLMMAAGAAIASVLEYVVSFSMEKLFDQRWWDYSSYKFERNGRVCMSITLFWALFSIAAVKFVHPYIGVLITNHLSDKVGVIIVYIGFGLLFIDAVISGIVAAKNKGTDKARKD